MPRNPYFDPAKFHHTRSGFRNPEGSKQRPKFNVSIAREAAAFAAELFRSAGQNPFPEQHVIPETSSLQGYHHTESHNKLLWLGHASFLLKLGSHSILTDPYLTDYASPMPSRSTKRLIPAAISINKLPVVSCIVISHNHYDHLDTQALSLLAKRFPDVLVCVPLGLKALLERSGFNQIVELDWYDQHRHVDLMVTGLPAIHTSRRGINDHNHSLWCGFAIEANGYRVYFAGDTAYGPAFKQVGKSVGGFDLGLVPIGAYQPRSLMETVHATPEEAIQIGLDMGAKRLVGMHWGTIRLTTEPMQEPKQRFLAAKQAIPRAVLRIGETIPLD